MRAARLAPLLAATAFAHAAACETADPVDDGVADVRLACELRAAWSTKAAERCAQCRTAAILPRCECEDLRDFSAACFDEANARRAEPSCTAELDACVRACPEEDCACLDDCYAGAPSCREKSSARDGCVADVCAAPCNGG